MHIIILSIEINNDGGPLFYLVVIVFILSSLTIWNQRKNITLLKSKH